MYALTLSVHAILGWIVVAFGLAVVARALRGLSGGAPWTASDDRVGLGFIAFLDLQLLVGLVLFLYSPVTILGRHELDLTFRSSTLRFFTLVHPILMTAAVAFAHMARVRLRREVDPAIRHRRAAVGVGLVMLIIAATIPWPFLPYGRSILFWVR